MCLAECQVYNTWSINVYFFHFPKSKRAALLMIHHHFMFHYINRNSTPGKIKHQKEQQQNVTEVQKIQPKRKAIGTEINCLRGAKLQGDSIFQNVWKVLASWRHTLLNLSFFFFLSILHSFSPSYSILSHPSLRSQNQTHLPPSTYFSIS